MTTWLAIFARVAPIVALHPVFGGRSVPRSLVPVVAAAIASAMYASLGGTTSIHQPLATIVIQCAIGVSIGVSGVVVVGAIESAARLVDESRGANAAQYYVPQLETYSSPLAQLEALASVAVFWVTGLYRPFTRALFASFSALPIDADTLTTLHRADAVELIAHIAASIVAAAAALAAPAIATSLIVDVALGLVNRASPQANVFFLGLPVKLLAVVAVMAIGLPGRAEIWNGLWTSDLEWLRRVWGS